MRNFKVFCLISAILIIFSSNVIAYNQSKFAPSDGKTMVMIGQDTGNISDFVGQVGHTPAGTMAYTSIQNLEGLYSASNHGAGWNHAQGLADTYINSVIQVGLYMVDGLDEVNAGTYDNNIHSLGSWAKSVDRPVYLRIGYEFDGDHNHYDPAKYQQAYRRIVDTLNADGVDNIAYVWHSQAMNVDKSIEDWYPGDEYVDWCGVSYFRQAMGYYNEMLDFSELHDKPIMLAESTPVRLHTYQGQMVWDNFFAQYFEFIEENGIEALCYINCDWDAMPMWMDYGWGDSRIQESEYLKQKWLAEMSKERYLQASSDLYSELGYNTIPEPSSVMFLGSGILMLWGILKNGKREVL
ncbi:MAG: hypothetical protein GY853_11980 [PVC group bacterium]|nr:hypothetical protein [PVC group bacterium]